MHVSFHIKVSFSQHHSARCLPLEFGGKCRSWPTQRRILFLVHLVWAWSSSLFMVRPRKWELAIGVIDIHVIFSSWGDLDIFWCSSTYLEKLLVYSPLGYLSTYLEARLIILWTFGMLYKTRRFIGGHPSLVWRQMAMMTWSNLDEGFP